MSARLTTVRLVEAVVGWHTVSRRYSTTHRPSPEASRWRAESQLYLPGLAGGVTAATVCNRLSSGSQSVRASRVRMMRRGARVGPGSRGRRAVGRLVRLRVWRQAPASSHTWERGRRG
jgi:hypothetical protein